MRESISNAYVFNLVIIFVAIVISLSIGSMSYSKTFKVKNRIIEIIEKNRSYNSAAKAEIDSALRQIGYKVNQNGRQNCPIYKGKAAINNNNTNYRYCVYEFDTGVKGSYYAVAAYMYLDLPVVGGNIEYPIYGETKLNYDID